MRTGLNGRIAIQWKQTELDGLEAAPLSFLDVGAAWSWRGQVMFLVDPTDQDSTQTIVSPNHFRSFHGLESSVQGIVVLTNGAQEFSADLCLISGESAPILVFENGYPAREQEFWVTEFIQMRQSSGEAAPVDDTVVVFPNRLNSSTDGQAPVRRPAVNAGPMRD